MNDAPRTTGVPEALLKDGLYLWRDKRRVTGPLPHPCPHRVDDTVTWWLSVMTASRKASQSEDAFAIDARHALLTWLDMPAKHRGLIASGVIDDGVAYRGDSFPMYVAIWEETVRAREIPAEDYVAQCFAAMRQAIAGMGMFPETEESNADTLRTKSNADLHRGPHKRSTG